jgi:hypothetical protein
MQITFNKNSGQLTAHLLSKLNQSNFQLYAINEFTHK